FNQDDTENRYSLVEDPSIQRGGCKLSTDDSVIDATIDSQVAQIAAKLLGSQRTSTHKED
ncbi:MAG: FliH/SctL family protein, partial [Pseudomonadota bacterium]